MDREGSSLPRGSGARAACGRDEPGEHAQHGATTGHRREGPLGAEGAGAGEREEDHGSDPQDDSSEEPRDGMAPERAGGGHRAGDLVGRAGARRHGGVGGDPGRAGRPRAGRSPWPPSVLVSGSLTLRSVGIVARPPRLPASQRWGGAHSPVLVPHLPLWAINFSPTAVRVGLGPGGAATSEVAASAPRAPQMWWATHVMPWKAR